MNIFKNRKAKCTRGTTQRHCRCCHRQGLQEPTVHSARLRSQRTRSDGGARSSGAISTIQIHRAIGPSSMLNQMRLRITDELKAATGGQLRGSGAGFFGATLRIDNTATRVMPHRALALIKDVANRTT